MPTQENFNAYEEHRVLMNTIAVEEKDSWHPECSAIIKQYLPKTNYLNTVDIACCGGSTLNEIGVTGDRLTLLDFAENQLERAQKLLEPKFKSIECIHADLSKEPEKILTNGPYDLVVCSHIIQHIQNEHEAERIAKIALQALANGGTFVFVCYRLRPILPFIPIPEKREGFFKQKESGLRLFFRRYTPKEIKALFEELNCVVLHDKSKIGDIVYIGQKD